MFLDIKANASILFFIQRLKFFVHNRISGFSGYKLDLQRKYRVSNIECNSGIIIRYKINYGSEPVLTTMHWHVLVGTYTSIPNCRQVGAVPSTLRMPALSCLAFCANMRRLSSFFSFSFCAIFFSICARVSTASRACRAKWTTCRVNTRPTLFLMTKITIKK